MNNWLMKAERLAAVLLDLSDRDFFSLDEAQKLFDKEYPYCQGIFFDVATKTFDFDE